MGHSAGWLVFASCKLYVPVRMHKLLIVQTAAYNRQLPIVKYLLDIGADTEVADIGSR